ncbi:BatA domain-containing protein [Olivibacter sitiensis]|uniref:BatA domain-containing protein n=1 Tax=Olivibacter sitiensis TaxID=376470 RepID=UPI00042998D7|nr:BatA domain-containing protein [Olivibacter sitiensis]
MELLYPLALFAAFGIIVPILVHLWNRRRLRVLRVGNVDIIGKGKQQQIKKFRIKNWPLFLLRCLLILCLALALAQPRFVGNSAKSYGAGWVLLGNGFQEGLNEWQWSTIDSLVKAGYQLRAFDSTFRQIEKDKDSVLKSHDLFSLIHRLNGKLDPDFPVFVFARPFLTQMQGDVPSASFNLRWQDLAQGYSTATYSVRYAWKADGDSIALLQSSATDKSTRLWKTSLVDDGTTQDLMTKVDKGILQVKHVDQDNWIAVDTQTYHIQIAAESAMADKRYVEAFLRTFAHHSSLPIKVSDYSPGTKCDFLFDLTLDGVKPDSTYKTVFRYAQGKAETQEQNRLLQTGKQSNAVDPILYKMIVANDDAASLWTDAFGRSVLTRYQEQGRMFYTFHSRFNPQWTDLVWKRDMVDYLSPILLHALFPPAANDEYADSNDKRSFGGDIILPRTKIHKGDGDRSSSWEMQAPLIWLALLLFLMERIMSYRLKGKEDVS